MKKSTRARASAGTTNKKKSATRRQHYVVFRSPGTLFAEESGSKIDKWDTAEAIKLSKGIKERYNATPYSFHFTTHIVADPIPDGEGGTLQVNSKEVDCSNRYFITGKLFSYADIEKRNLKDEDILRSNMRCNKWAYIVENTNSWKIQLEFSENDCIVDEAGNVLVRGDDPKLMKYRKQFDKECDKYFEEQTRKWNEQRG